MNFLKYLIPTIIACGFLGACADHRTPFKPSEFVALEVTGYCKCGSCCGWKRNIWLQPVYASGPQAGERKKVGITACGTEAKPGHDRRGHQCLPFEPGSEFRDTVGALWKTGAERSRGAARSLLRFSRRGSSVGTPQCDGRSDPALSLGRLSAGMAGMMTPARVAPLLHPRPARLTPDEEFPASPSTGRTSLAGW